jgi:hypothetical protein
MQRLGTFFGIAAKSSGPFSFSESMAIVGAILVFLDDILD